MHDDDARHLYVDVAEPLQDRAAALAAAPTAGRSTRSGLSAPSSRRARSAEAEGELEKLTRSGYRTVVAFEGRGEAERARYNLDRHRRAVPRAARRRPRSRV